MKRLLFPVALLAAAPAFAHHPMGGAAPQTLFEGLASGLAHPVIGIDHLAFVVLVGLAAAASGRRFVGPAAFVLATMAGTMIQLAGVALPVAELVIAASIVVLGAVLLLRRDLSGPAALAGFAFAGAFHGWAFGATVIGSQAGAVGSYLAGFGLVQFGVASGVAWVAAHALRGSAAAGGWARVAAAVCCGIGVAFLVEGVEAMILA